jgi:colanic acid/amylovoran biosynthesis protein
MRNQDKTAINIVLLGASFDTGNLGVTALASSTISLIKQRWPTSQVYLLGGKEFTTGQMENNNFPITFRTCPVRYGSNLLAKNHIWKLLFAITFMKFTHCPFHKKNKQDNDITFQNSVTNKKTTLKIILNADFFCDITGGDSFSDIYGIVRFTKGYLLKRTCQMTAKPFIMLPQTYGPFKSPVTKWMAKQILRETQTIYSRDKEGLKAIENLIGKSGKIKLCPDVAFTLESRAPASTNFLPATSKQNLEGKSVKRIVTNSQLIGLNVSGLLFHGGYTGKNEFGLKDNYKELVREIVDYFVSMENTMILLVPHVVPEGWETENDLIACRKLQETLPNEIREKVIIAEPEQGQPFFDQCEIKYLIGCCDFFLGSRMHATIAAISQKIPTIGLAYSKKFVGVYETAGVDDCVTDLRTLTNEKVMILIKNTYSNRVVINKRLEQTIPEVKKTVYAIFEGI